MTKDVVTIPESKHNKDVCGKLLYWPVYQFEPLIEARKHTELGFVVPVDPQGRQAFVENLSLIHI